MEALKAYVCAVVPATLGVGVEAVRAGWDASLEEVVDDGDVDRAVETFVFESGQQVLYIERQSDGSVRFASEVGFGGQGCAGAVLVKRHPLALDKSHSTSGDDDNNRSDDQDQSQHHRRDAESFQICDKIRYAVLNLAQRSNHSSSPALSSPATTSSNVNADSSSEDQATGGDDVLNGVYDYIHFGLGPLLKSYGTIMTSGGKKSGSSAEDETPTASSILGNANGSAPTISEAMRQALPLISKRMNELEYAMRSCLQSTEIPEVRLAVDSVVTEALTNAGGSADGKALEEIGLGEDKRDAKMLNRLQAGVNRWVKEIQKVTKLDRDAGTGSVSQEVQFWRNLERALQQIQRQVDGPEVRLTLDILKQSRRALATILFENDTGLQSALKRVNNYMILMQDFPIGGLLAATDVNQIQEAIVQIFTHLKKIKSADEYPLTQAMRLVESLSRDMNAQLLAVLSSSNLMHMPFAEFEQIIRSTQILFRTWDDSVRGFRELARDLAKRRGSERLPPKLSFEHVHLQERLEDLRAFRASHDKLQTVLEKVVLTHDNLSASSVSSTLASQDADANQRKDISEEEEQKAALSAASENPDSIESAYEIVSSIDVLNLSREGASAWESAKTMYERRVDRIERRIIEHLTDKLGAAKTADEMFRVFSRFNALFFRPRIRGAIQQFQTRLIGTVEEDIEALQRTFKRSYGQSQASLMSRVKDVPPVSGAIIWARQIERQLDQLLSRVEAVLGAGWEQHVEGRRLKETGAAFKKKLNTQAMFDQWMKNIQNAPSFEVTGRLFRVEENASGTALTLSVNFDPEIVELFKEVRNLQWLGFRIPYTLKVISDEAKEKYPYAMSLQSSLEAYKLTISQMDDELASLLSTYVSEAQAVIEAAFEKSGKAVNWDSDGLRDYAADFAQRVQALQDKVVAASEKTMAVQEQLLHLKSCPYSPEALGGCIDAMQRIVDEMNLASYTNLNAWVAHLEDRIDCALQERLSSALDSWVKRFNAGETADSWHEIVLRKHALYLEPPLQEARFTCIRSLHEQVDIVADLPRIHSARYDTGNAVAVTRRKSLLRAASAGEESSSGDFEAGLGLLTNAYTQIEARMQEIDTYVRTWLQYQALWEMESNEVFETMGNSFTQWHRLLKDVQTARTTFDTAEHMRHFGPVTVDFQQVQAQISLRYDAWHKELLGKFGTLLGDAMKGFYDTVSHMRNELEAGSFDAPTADVVNYITVLRKVQARRISLGSDLDSFIEAERLAQRQRMQFPSNWIWSANIQGEWDALEQLLARKERILETELPTLQSKILAEDKAVASRIDQLAADWTEQRPVGGNSRPAEALEVLSLFSTRKAHAKDEWERVSLAKEALQGAEFGNDSSAVQDHPVLDNLGNEIESLQEVWKSLAEVAETLAQLRELPWTAVVPKKLRVSLDSILDELRKLPSRVRQYEAFEYIQETVRDYKKTQPLIIELRSESLKDRHWRQITRELGLKTVSDLTLGDLWATDLKRHQKPLQDIFRTAQGEMALEEFLRQIREFWSSYELDLVNFQNRCRIVRGWDDLFTQLDEHTNSLASMKQSPYFKVFEEEASTWEDKLLRIRVVLDIWIDVQRRWVYLGAILLGSADIKQQLPNEYSRFSSIDGEFITLMRKVSRAPRILEVINSMPNLDHSLGRLADLLEKIQRALGDYLERQRQSFSRFYFVGDEDLLEIIGNSKDPIKVQRHMSKMFAGIVSLKIDEEANAATAMVSREGEIVPFQPAPVMIDGKVNDWLGGVERAMRTTLSTLLRSANESNPLSRPTSEQGEDAFTPWLDRYPSQILILASQVSWCASVDAVLASRDSMETGQQLSALCDRTEHWLGILAERVLSGNLSTEVRKKHEQIITEMVHQRDVLRKLAVRSSSGQDTSAHAFEWLSQIRYQWQQDRLSLHIANATFDYGFEYQGVGERLVQTPLTDRCYLALTQALHFRLGGNPFGPAGTGKTESVKALGAQLGRFVLVFNCDEHFDLKAMGRIFVGLCQVGAWGCFDEFNRLEERILSAVSQQILDIQRALLEKKSELTLLDKPVSLNPNVGIFVTMNPGYAGRSNLPDNLKQLFRSIAMIEPDRDLIAQVMLYSQGFKSAERLAGKIVLLFKLCADQLSQQPHYDFGLRAVKSVLLSAGNLKRGSKDDEQDILIRSLCENVVPKLVSEDVMLFQTLLAGVFPGAEVATADAKALRDAIYHVCEAWCLVPSERWVNKVLQLDQVQQMRHGIMMVGPSGSGKSSSWRVLLEALELVDGQKGQAHVIDPKAISKEALYGTLDPNTLEWTNGIFTHTLRTILNNVRGEKTKRHWIVFDGDVDPEWAENLNSVLDDNKLLTLPNGERLSIPDNVRIMFEVETLKYATLATVSRCGMVWYSEDTLSIDDIFNNRIRLLEAGRTKSEAASNWPPIASLTNASTSDSSKAGIASAGVGRPEEDTEIEIEASIESQCSEIVQPLLAPGGLVQQVLPIAMELPHVMDVTQMRLIVSFFSLLGRGFAAVSEYNQNRPEFPMEDEHMQIFLSRWALFSVLWGFGGSMDFEARHKLAVAVGSRTTIDLPTADPAELWDFEVNVEDGGWRPWKESVPKMEIDPHRVMDTDLVIPTVDTVRHAQVLHAWLDEHRPLILCGPPGSGKTMSLTSVLQGMPNFELASLNFSSATTPELILKTFEQYCVYKTTRSGVVLAPPQPDRWLVVFCDEVNLPVTDAYGTQHVITFMRQIVEQGGFWRPRDLAWVSVERIQFVSACNPPTDPGRVPLSHRFLRHTPLLLVDYPVPDSLRQIYGTFNRALLKLQPPLRAHGDALTDAMVDVYAANKAKFSADVAPHYVYSPRELSRWMRALYEALGQMESVSVDQLVRLWLHEGLRLFHDRLISSEERGWCSENLDEIAQSRFPGADHNEALARPVLFANWITKNYVSVSQDELREHVEARLRVFYEEELNVPLVVFDDVLEHVLRIDRVLRQPLGHLLLVGKSGAGKTVLSRFVAWMNGLRVFQIKLSRKYSLDDFDEDLRYIMKQAGCQGEKVCFIFDESNVLESAFLERMNALLASGEVPGLFEGDEYNSLMSTCREALQRDGTSGAVIDTDDDEEVFKAFTRNVQRNLHVVFTMNPASSDLKNRAATSPALFNRCVVDWFGDWSGQALAQVAHEFTRTLDLEASSQDYVPPSQDAIDEIEVCLAGAAKSEDEQLRYRHAVVASLVSIHDSVQKISLVQAGRHENHTYVSPRDYLDLIKHYVDLYNKKREHLEEQQLHLNIGLDKLRETAEQVEQLGQSLSVKEAELEAKNKEANAKLQQMVSDQNEAEKKKNDAEQMGIELDERNAKVDEQRATAEAELSRAKPALIDAEKAVSDIRRAHLDEMRSLNNPPAAVKLTLEAVCVMLGLSFSSWADIRRILQRREFIPDVVNFNSEDLDEDRRAKVSKMLENPDFVEEKVMHANKACVALFKWIVSQLDYAGILLRIQPLREEIEELALESETLRERQSEEMAKVTELEAQIVQLKEEYAVLIAETETIKSQMNTVKTKVERSTALLNSLSQENERWSEARIGFSDQMATLVGDVLLSAAFISYGGFFGFQQRQAFLTEWRDLLARFGIVFRKSLSLVEYMARPSERLTWHAEGLPKDNLCEENAVILENFNRFPLVVDPSGQASDFLMKHLKDRKVVKTSFLDASFMKQLESALRFGTCLVITDVENIDPILNPVLNREIHRTGGRMLVRLGDQDIDFSPSFSMYLTTRDSTFQFAPDVCSRVTFVNFTVTPASLEALCLGKVLRAERPDVERQREDLLKLQGEFQARLRELEDRLLDSINEAQGNILDNDSIIHTLESLKQEAKDIQQKAAEADEVLETVAKVSTFYGHFAAMCSRAYFALGRMVEVHFTYHFSLAFFFEVLDGLLGNTQADSKSTHEARLETLRARFLAELFRRVKQSLMERDELLFAAILAGAADPELGARLTETLASDAAADLSAAREVIKDLPTEVRGEVDVSALAQTLQTRPELVESISSNTNAWVSMARSETPEHEMPEGWDKDPVDRVLALRIFRPDRVFAGLTCVVDTTFGKSFLDPQRTMLDLSTAIADEAKASTPVLLLSTRGFDMSGKVDRLAVAAGVRCRSVALGSAEGFRDADAAIAAGAQEGGWVMLKNVHLASEWLLALEKRIYGMRARNDFRLILTSELSEKLPKTLLRQSNKLMFEAPKGIKASLLRSLQAMPTDRMERAPKERSRLYFSLAWFHAVLLERLRFAPIGWTKLYEFSDADQTCAMDVIDEWVDRIANGREHVAPEELPWAAIRSILAESTYGGRIDNEFDQQILDGILEGVFVPEIFETDFNLVDGVLQAPEGASKARFEAWVADLPSSNDPSWLGLSRTAENILLKNESARFQRIFVRLEAGEHSMLVDVAGDESLESSSEDTVSNRPAWMITALQQVQVWSDKAEKADSLMKLCESKLCRTEELVSNPIFRCWEREARTAVTTLRDLRTKSTGMLAVLRGEQRMTNELQALATHIQQKTVPADWLAVMPAASLDAWVQDFFVRLDSFEKVLSKGESAFRLPLQLDFGLLFSPGAFLTATRQQVAKSSGLSLEELLLFASFDGEHDQSDTASFTSQVILEGGSQIEDANSSRSSVSCTFLWSQNVTPDASKHVRLPLYTNASRSHLLSDVHVSADLGNNVILRGVALIAHPTF